MSSMCNCETCTGKYDGRSESAEERDEEVEQVEDRNEDE